MFSYNTIDNRIHSSTHIRSQFYSVLRVLFYLMAEFPSINIALVPLQLQPQLYYNHRRRIYTEAKAYCRCHTGHPHASIKIVGELYLYISYFIIDRLVFHQMFYSILANKIINKIIKSVFNLK